jgi:dipeptidyl aminopeptidase/acylaminoacyl peptidase
MSGHGELAVIHAHELFLVGGPVSGVHYVGFGNQPSDPQWSSDGKWLTVTVTPPAPKTNPYADEPSKVWLVSPTGKTVRVLSTDEIKTYDVTAAWSPVADRVAISYTNHSKNPSNDKDHLEIVDASNGVADGVLVAPVISGFAWSPDGQRLAVGRNVFTGEPGAWQSKLITINAGSDARRTVTTAKGDVLEVAGWWPDGSGILTRLDYQGSASLAADGLPLLDVSLANGDRRRLAGSALAYPQWLATSKVSNQVAFVAGGDREVTLGHKRLEVCGAASCHVFEQGGAQVSFDPAWSTTGRLAFVRDRAIDTKDGFGLSYVNKIQSSGGIVLGSVGSGVQPVAAGKRASAPTWGRDGSMLIVRDDALWLLAPGLHHAVKVVSGVQVDSNYYGFVPWHDSFAWSEAAV